MLTFRRCDSENIAVIFAVFDLSQYEVQFLQESCAVAKMSARCTIRQYAHGLKLESPFVPSSTDCWDVRAKMRQNGRLGGRRGETGSRNMPATQKNRKSVGDFL